MKLRRCFAPRQLLFLLTAASLAGARPALSQETVTTRDGQVKEGKIERVVGPEVQIQAVDGMTKVRLQDIAQVNMAAPASYMSAYAAYERGDYKGAARAMGDLAMQYRGLPVDWARNAMLEASSMDVAAGDLSGAELALNDYKKAYPDADPSEIAVGMALIDVAKKDYDAANAKIAPAIDAALKVRTSTTGKSGLYGRAFYISGQIREQAGEYNGALTDYLRTVVLFPQDRIATQGASGRADSLRRDQGAIVP